jgi:hypothetical protein
MEKIKFKFGLPYCNIYIKWVMFKKKILKSLLYEVTNTATIHTNNNCKISNFFFGTIEEQSPVKFQI